MDLKKIFEDVPAGAGRYGVVGHHIPYTLSPAMHTAALARFKIPAVYRKIDVAPEAWEAFVQQAPKVLSGFNITRPYKQRIAESFERVKKTRYAQIANSVNTMKRLRESGHGFDWEAHSTDGMGFIEDLAENKVDLEGKRVVVLGSGGVAYAIVGDILGTEIAQLTIVNRTRENAQKMLAYFEGLKNDPRLKSIGFPTLPAVTVLTDGELRERHLKDADLLINTTPHGQKNEPNPIVKGDWLHKNLTTYDTIYERVTPLLKNARERGGKTIGGLGMLVNQGARTFEFWFEGYLKKKVDYSFLDLRRVMRDAAEKALKERETA